MDAEELLKIAAQAVKDKQRIYDYRTEKINSTIKNQKYQPSVAGQTTSSPMDSIDQMLDKQLHVFDEREKECDCIIDTAWNVLEQLSRRRSVELEQILSARYMFNESWTKIAHAHGYKSHNTVISKAKQAIDWLDYHYQFSYLPTGQINVIPLV
ncbi:hypothetical protein [Atopobium fossor]|uniref:hypothetical protein n=1 Tax=Atopobium fossor TaxID=39487 RepID=UPI0004813F90|nr:hypothetical protein [Atopobium fossor]